ncbi:hypothetical protein AYO52_12955 [Dietzia sp. 111N12-1]|nr:hypothetical protein AYO52_12955 [Dietzia sp. 111N12-1]
MIGVGFSGHVIDCQVQLAQWLTHLLCQSLGGRGEADDPSVVDEERNVQFHFQGVNATAH